MTPDQVEIVAERRQEESRRSASESEEQARFESPVLSGAIVGINPYHLFESERDRQIIASYVRHTSIFCRMCGGDGGPGGRCSRCGGNGLEPDWDADG